MKREDEKTGRHKQRNFNGRYKKDCTFSRNKSPKFHLTRCSSRKLLLFSTAAAIDFTPSSPIWLKPCAAHVNPCAPRYQKKRNFSRNKTSKVRLTRPSHRKLLLPSTADAIDFAPSSPIWLKPCTAHVSQEVGQHATSGKYAAEAEQDDILQGTVSSIC